MAQVEGRYEGSRRRGLLMALSWSQFNMWRDCPYKWYGFYRLKLVPRVKNIHFSVGSATHDAIQKALSAWQYKSRLTVAEMVGVFSKYLQDDGVVSDPDTLQYWTLSAQNMFQGWMGWASTHEIEVEALEKKVVTTNFLGYIDCIARVDSQRYIIDWKTSSSAYDQKRADTDDQVTVYRWLDGCTPDTKVAYGVLIKGTSRFQFLESERTDEDVSKLTSEIRGMEDTTTTYGVDDMPEKRPGSPCKWCELYSMGHCEGEDDF